MVQDKTEGYWNHLKSIGLGFSPFLKKIKKNGFSQMIIKYDFVNKPLKSKYYAIYKSLYPFCLEYKKPNAASWNKGNKR